MMNFFFLENEMHYLAVWVTVMIVVFTLSLFPFLERKQFLETLFTVASLADIPGLATRLALSGFCVPWEVS